MPDCVLNSCSIMTAGNCGTPLPAQSDVTLGANPYSIGATELNSAGYSHSICYSCDIKPTGLPMITFTKDSIVIASPGLDCSDALVEKSFPNPVLIKTFKYSGSTKKEVIALGWNEFFGSL